MSRAGERDPSRSVAAQLACAGLAGTVVNTSVTVAVAAIADDLGVPLALAAVSVVLMNVAMAFAMPLAGEAARVLGSRGLLVASGALVIGSSCLLALSPNVVTLGLARVGQGIALAGITPTSVQVSTQLLDGAQRARALGWWAASNGLGLAFGPLIGGLLLDIGGWRWVALPAALLGAGLVVTARLAVPADLRHDPGVPLRVVICLSVLAGSVMSALAALVAGLWAVAVPFALTAVAVALVLRRGSRRTRTPDGLASWLRDVDVRRPSLGAVLQMLANGMVQVTVPAWLILGGVTSGGPAGAVLMAMTLTMAAMGLVTGRRADVPYGRWLRWGLSGCAVGLAALAAATVGTWWVALPALVILGLGAGALLSPSFTAFSHTPAGHNAVGLAMFNVLRLSAFAVGGLLGGSLLDLGLPWLAFASAAVACGGSSAFLRDRRPVSSG